MQNELFMASTLQLAYLLNPDPISNSVTKRTLATVGIETRELLEPAKLFEALPLASPGCLLIEFALHEMHGLRVMELLRQKECYTPCIFISAHVDPTLVVTAMNQGAFGFVKKPFQQIELLDMVQRAINHQRSIQPYISLALEYRRACEHLTPREKQILKLLETGHTAKKTGEVLNISVRTVENARLRIFGKLNLSSRGQLIRRVAILDLLYAMGVFR